MLGKNKSKINKPKFIILLEKMVNEKEFKEKYGTIEIFHEKRELSTKDNSGYYINYINDMGLNNEMIIKFKLFPESKCKSYFKIKIKYRDEVNFICIISYDYMINLRDFYNRGDIYFDVKKGEPESKFILDKFRGLRKTFYKDDSIGKDCEFLFSSVKDSIISDLDYIRKTIPLN